MFFINAGIQGSASFDYNHTDICTCMNSDCAPLPHQVLCPRCGNSFDPHDNCKWFGPTSVTMSINPLRCSCGSIICKSCNKVKREGFYQ